MKQKILLGAVAASLMMTSCSQDEPVQVAGTDEIRFSVATESQSRAAESFCANWLPGSFSIWAKTNPGGELYIPGDVVTNSDGSTYGFAGDNVRFWPKEGNLDFLAFSGDDETFNHSLTAPKFVNFKVKDDPTEQRDLIYAVRSDVAKGSNGTVALNFRHALSQVVFQASVSNPNLKIVVSNVKIGGLKNQGTYSLPAQETAGSFLDPSHNDAQEDISALPSKGIGAWSNLSGNQAYTVTAAYWADSQTLRETVTINSGETRVISSTNKNHLSTDYVNDGQTVIGNPWGKVLNLIPQYSQAWIPGQSAGSYIALECEIYTTEGGREKLLTEKSWTYVPVEVNWRQGVRYVYTLDFGNGNAGWTDGPDGPNPQPTLSNISVNCVSVDDFAKLGGETKTFTVKFKEDGIKTPGFEDIVCETTRNQFTFTIPKTAPNYPYKDIYLSAGTTYEQVSCKPTFYTWTQSWIDPHAFISYNYLNKKGQSGMFGLGSSRTMPLEQGQYDLELVPVWTYNVIVEKRYHFKELFGKDEPNHSAVYASGSHYIVGNPLAENVCLIEVRTSHVGVLDLIPEGYEFVGLSRTFDPDTKNIDIEPEYTVRTESTYGGLSEFAYPPLSICTLKNTGDFYVELHAVYKKIATE